MGYNKTVYAKQRQVVSEDGEILDDETIKFDVYVKDHEEFLFQYKKHLLILLKLNGNEYKVITWCSHNCMFNTNEIVLSISVKKRLAKDANLSLGSVNNAISSLSKRNFLIRLDTSHYKVNPEVNWKGHSKARDKNLSIHIKYKVGGPE